MLPSFNRDTYQLWLLLGLLTLLVVFGVQGIEHGRVNNFRDQSVQLPVIYSYENPDLFHNDFLLEARDSYVTWFYRALGFIARFLPLSDVMQALYVLSIVLALGAVYQIGNTLFPQARAGLFAAILWMVYYPNPGGDFTHSPFVTHTTFAIAIEMWALLFILRRRYSWAALLLGLAANINAMTAFFVAFMWLAALAVSPREWNWRLLRIPAIMVLAALPILIWRLSLPLHEASLDQFVDVIRVRLWYAVFPFSIEPLLWLGFFILLGLWLYSLRYGVPTAHRRVLAMGGGIGFISLVGLVFSEILPVELFIELQLIRSTWLINILIMFYLANMVSRLLASDWTWDHAAAIGLIVYLTLPRWLVELDPPPQPTPYPLVVDLDTPGLANYPGIVAAVLLLSLAGSAWIIWRWLRAGYGSFEPAAARRVVSWCTVALVMVAFHALIATNVPDEQSALTDDWSDTLAWIERNTPEDAYFVSPPTLDGFRVEARRPYVGDWKDGTVGIFHNGWALEWYDRMLALGFSPDTFSFEPMTQDRLCHVAHQFDVDYAVVLQSWQIDGEPAYENTRFAVLPRAQLDCTVVARGVDATPAVDTAGDTLYANQ